MGAFTKGIFLVNVAFQVYHWEYSPKGSLHWELLIHSWHDAKGRQIALSWRDASENLYALIDLLGSGSILVFLREERHLEPSKSISHALISEISLHGQHQLQTILANRTEQNKKYITKIVQIKQKPKLLWNSAFVYI